MSSTDPVLRQDLAHCQALLRRGSKSFWAAGRLLPADQRDAFAAVYAFCRTADDAIDLAHADAGAVRAQQQRIDRAYAGAAPVHPGDAALAWVVRHYLLPRAIFDALVEGFAWDAERRQYESESELFDYAARVASCVGAAVTLIMGPRDPETLARACDLGLAMQLTNIARDVGEDARNGRLYLPRAWMREEGLDPDAFLAAPRFSPALSRVVRRLLASADALYERAAHGIPDLPARSQPAIRAARMLYRDIGRVIAERGYDSVNSRAWTSAPRKAWLLLCAIAGTDAYDAVSAAAPPLRETRFLVDAAAQEVA
jgi:phytoene synthase